VARNQLDQPPGVAIESVRALLLGGRVDLPGGLQSATKTHAAGFTQTIAAGNIYG
jgi:hypothetical protein